MVATPRGALSVTTDASVQIGFQFHDLAIHRAARQNLGYSLMGLLPPRDHNKTMTILASPVPGGDHQRLQQFQHDSLGRGWMER